MPTTATASNAASISPRMLPSRCRARSARAAPPSRRSSKARIGSDAFAPAPPQLRHEDAPESGVAENSRERIHHGRKGFTAEGALPAIATKSSTISPMPSTRMQVAISAFCWREVVVGHALRNARHLHDALHRRVCVAAFGNDLDRRIQQLAPGGVRLARSPSAGPCPTFPPAQPTMPRAKRLDRLRAVGQPLILVIAAHGCGH